METVDLLRALQEVEKRAERVSDEHVIATYVGAGSLVQALTTKDNGILFGRRGTGKTHALKYLAETERAKGNFVVYIDMEQDIGSTEGRYVDMSLSVAERATRLLVDVLSIIHDRLVEDAFAGRAKSQIDTLDRALDHFGEVVVVETAEKETTAGRETEVSGSGAIDLSLKGVSVSAGASDRAKNMSGGRYKVSGPIRHRVHFGALGKLLREVVSSHEADRCWILLDEWSGVPLDLQPYLAEMLRRLFFGIPKVTVRLAAIPHRSEWRVVGERGDYVGLEIGAEVFPLLDLDEFVVFPARNRAEQTQRSVNFFKSLLHKHISQVLESAGIKPPSTPDELVNLLFSQVTALEEMIRAAEGVPRDALNILSRAALRAGDTKITVSHIRGAAAQLYQTTKAAQLNAVPPARKLLDVIIRDVISGRKARAFLLAQEHTDNPLIQQLVDDRILHIIKKGYSSKDDPGTRFDVLQIDYGCYVQLLGTNSAPQLLLGADTTADDLALGVFYGDVEVPEDDYRAIRRAVLDLPALLEDLFGPEQADPAGA